LATASFAFQRTHAWRVGCLILGFVVFSSPILAQRMHGEALPFPAVTIVFALVVVLILATWRVYQIDTDAGFALGHASAVVGTSAAALLALAAWRFVDLIVWSPYTADMLLVTREAIRRLLKGHDPYALYHVPWEAPLPYGPVLWGPFLIPQMLHADYRLVTVVGELFVPLCCGLVAIVEAGRSRLVAAGAWIVLLAAIVFDPDLMMFTTGGHTPGYWPLLPLFAAFATAENWPAAAFVLALLVAGRSTMVALVPVFAMAVWIHNRRQAVRVFAIWAIALLVLLLPFALWDVHAFWYGMVASYPRVIKQVVWTSADGGAIRTIGVTGWLLAHHLERFAEATQIVALALVYALAWRALHRGARPLPWMGIALLTFSMTTLWPVFYIYFDVLLFFVSAAIADTIGAIRPRLLVGIWAVAIAVLAMTAGAMLVASSASHSVIEAGSPDGARALSQGFSEPESDGGRRFAWVRGLTAGIVLPRDSIAAAEIVVTGQPVIIAGGRPQTVTATLNGSLLGTVFAGAGWQAVRFRAPRSAWQVGSNDLQLAFAQVNRPADVGLGRDRREAAFALSRVDVVPDDDGRSPR
jgi:hypothetical protein